MEKIIKYLDRIIYCSIILIPFSVSIALAPIGVFESFLIVSFLARKLLKKERLFIGTGVNTPLLLFFMISSLSFINSINYGDSLRGILKLLGYILVFFIIAEEIRNVKHIKIIIFSMASGIVLASFDAIWQVWIGKDFVRGYAPVINLGIVRATASFKDSNVLGIYLSAITPILLGPAIYYYKNKKRAVMLALCFMALIGILLTYSRPTLLAIYIALFLLGIVRRDKKVILLLLVFTLVSPFILPKAVKDWARQMEYNPFRFMCNDDRIAVYRNSLNMIKEHPFIGLGVNTYMKNYKKYKEPVEYRNIVTQDYMYAHNNFIHMAAEIGLAGLGIFLWFLYKLFAECKRIYGQLDNYYFKMVSLSLAACLVAFLINGLTESSLYYSRVAIIFWYIAGFALTLKKFAHANR